MEGMKMAQGNDYQVAVGDQVWIHGGVPGQRWTGTVVTVGPKYVHVDESPSGNGLRIVKYFRDYQGRADDHPGGFQTVAQYEESQAYQLATGRLRAHGLRIDVFSCVAVWDAKSLALLADAADLLHSLPEVND
jgi:hypothetical protein